MLREAVQAWEQGPTVRHSAFKRTPIRQSSELSGLEDASVPKQTDSLLADIEIMYGLEGLETKSGSLLDQLLVAINCDKVDANSSTALVS